MSVSDNLKLSEELNSVFGRHWTAKGQKRNQSDRFSSHPHSHYRHRKTKLPVCYRNFPLSLNALSKYSNIRKEYFLEPTDYRLSNRIETEKDIQMKTSVDIRKVSCLKMRSDTKVHDSFICFGEISLA